MFVCDLTGTTRRFEAVDMLEPLNPAKKATLSRNVRATFIVVTRKVGILIKVVSSIVGASHYDRLTQGLKLLRVENHALPHTNQ